MPRARSREGAQRIREFILSGAAQGALDPGARLPTERELARRFSVPRNAVRKTLAQLEAEGSITRHVGRGTFLAGDSRASDMSAASVAHTSPAEILDARLRIEPALAELVVTNATPADFERMEACLEKAEKSATLDEFEVWDQACNGAFTQPIFLER